MKPAKKALTPVNPKAVVVTVKAVYEVSNMDSVDDMLDDLRGSGAIVEIRKEYVAESYDEAVLLLGGAK